MVAKAVDAIVISSDESRDGIRILETHCDSHDVFVSLPRVVSCGDQLFGRSAWNSDRNVAYYRSDRVLAFGL